MFTVLEIIKKTTDFLAAKGVESPRLNAELLIGHALRPVTDQLRVPRERLAYVIDATAAPVCILVPLSTWAVYVAGLLEITGVAREGEGMRAYLGVIPWAFYGWIAVALVPLVVPFVFEATKKNAFDRALGGQPVIEFLAGGEVAGLGDEERRFGDHHVALRWFHRRPGRR